MLQTTKLSHRINALFLIIVAFLAAALSGYGQLTNILSAGLLVLILPICIIGIPEKISKAFWALIVFLVFFIVTSIPNYSSLYYLLGTCIMYTLITFAPFFIKIHVERKYDIGLKKKLFFFGTIIWFCIALISIKTYAGSAGGGRDFASDHRGLVLGGGYNAAYGSAILAVVCFYYLIAGKKGISKKVKALLFVGLILSAIHVFLTMSVITVVAMVLGCLISIFFRGKKTKRIHFGAIIFSIVLVSVTIFFLIHTESIGMWMMQTSLKIDNELISERFAEVGRFLYADNESYHIESRLYTLQVSWQTFLSHPVIGIGYKYGNTYDLLYQNGVGVHSELLDALAKYGIIGSIPYLYFFYHQIRSLVDKSLYRITIPVVVAFLIMFTFNPFLSVQTIFMLCLYLPILVELVEKQ